MTVRFQNASSAAVGWYVGTNPPRKGTLPPGDTHQVDLPGDQYAVSPPVNNY